MKKYLTQLQEEKTPHERRQFAMKVAGATTFLFFIVWASTLGIRLTENNANVANQNIPSTAATLYAVQQASSTLGY
jgi:hypothetical protein